MKHLRVAMALFLCLLLCGMSTLAYAAIDFTAAPKLKLTVPPDGITSRQTGYLTVESDLPGFLTMTLIDGTGALAQTICSNQEIPTGENSIEFNAVNDDNKGLPEGNYAVRAEMTSQFGVASDAVSVTLIILPNLNEEDEAAGEDEDDSGEQADESAATAVSEDEASKGETAAAPAKAEQPKATPQPVEKAAYGAGVSVMGEEGLLIGVGVTDVADQTDAGYWALTSDSSDAEIWAAMIREMPRVNVGETESAYIYDSPEKGRKKLGTVSGTSQGLNVITDREDGWSLVEAYRNEDGAFVRGYMSTKKITVASPNTDYGILIDKATQTLTVFKNGERIGSCDISTGLATAKQLHRETPAGEFICVTRRGSTEYYGKGYSKYTIRINGNYYLCEEPTTKKNGSEFTVLEGSIGEKCTRGSVVLPHAASADGGINAEWIWDMTDESKRVKVLILDDKDRSSVPVGSN